MEPTASALAIACALLCIILSIVTWHKRRGRFYEQASKFQGPPGLPIIGNAMLFAKGNEAILASLAELTRSYSSPFRFWLGHRLCIVASEPDQVKAILTSSKTYEKTSLYEFLKPIVGEGLFTAPTSIWRVHRKLIQPTFNSKLLNSFTTGFAVQSKMLADVFKPNLDGSEFKVFDHVALTTIRMLCETVMGLEIEAQMNSALCNYVDALQTVAMHGCTRMFNILLYPDVVFNHSQIGKEFWQSIKIIDDFTDTMIDNRKIELLKCGSGQSDTANTKDDEYERMPRREAFLDYFLKLSHEGVLLSDTELRDEVKTILIGGFDSTALTNSHIMLMLASHPDIQDEVYKELYEIYGDADVDERPVTHEDLGRMEYLERVIKETMRLFPLLPLTARRVTDDLEIGEHVIPRGSEVLIPVLEIHRSEKYWKDPLRFDPDRFLPEEVAKRHPCTYLAFSAGPRNCIGLKYAMMAMKTLQATILRRYVLKKNNVVPVKDIRFKMETALKMVEPVTLRIEKRTRN